ncbi:hypothetical protein EUTSA_v10003343mg [Eutrema salsugineum]|uniref:F-box domain-containing protein n=1 Tax=Eutrema salsugineum TaxID=72664 RepID=V4NEX7_EUTSA|nr:F-box/kelch-repeat protein At4g39560 [Eutrema salsugineum]ESQ44636.1 hypothetical protein EUTSA_v10003343mg [Eutrema salsugineum]
MMSGAVEQWRRKKRRRVVSPSPSPSPTSGLMSLPDDMVLNCLARVSRSDHRALSQVSKSSRSLVVSPDLYETRSRMGFTEDCIYICLLAPYSRNPVGWFTIRWRGRGEENRLTRIPMPPFPTPNRATFVPLGSRIYVIGGSISAESTSRVSFLDCRTHTWSQVPSMRVARAAASAGVLDGKIYVMGGCWDGDPSNWAEVFDPKMQTWSNVIIPDAVNWAYAPKVVGRDSYLYNFGSEGGMCNDLINTRDASCAIDKLLYCRDPKGRIMWCDPWSGVRKGRMEWYKVNGLEDLEGFLKDDFESQDMGKQILSDGVNADLWDSYLLKRGYPYGLEDLVPGSQLIKSGGNLFVFWGVLVGNHPRKRLQVWCAEISLERRHGGQIWGIIQCSDHVFTTGPDLTFLSSFNVNL